MDDVLVQQAKTQAARRGKSVSQMFVEFIASLEANKRKNSLPPVTSALLGIIKRTRLSERKYKKHLREKYS